MEQAAESSPAQRGLTDTVRGARCGLSAGEAMTAFLARHLPALRRRLEGIRFELSASHTLANLFAPPKPTCDPRAGARAREPGDAAARRVASRLWQSCLPRGGAPEAARGKASCARVAHAAVGRLRRRPQLHAGPGLAAACRRRAGRRCGNNWLVLHQTVRSGAAVGVLPCHIGDTDPALVRLGGVLPTSRRPVAAWCIATSARCRGARVMDALLQLFQDERTMIEGRARGVSRP